MALQKVSAFEPAVGAVEQAVEFCWALVLQQRVFVTVEPSKKFFIQRNKIERQLVKKLKKQTDIELLKAELEKLHNYQQKKESGSLCTFKSSRQCRNNDG